MLFSRDELKTRTQLITAVHAIPWTTVDWYSFDNIMELIGLVW